MQIGTASSLSGVSAKMIRHYETIGLVPVPARRHSNYRDYDDDDVHRLAFVRRARDLGFAIGEIRDLLRLWADKDRASADVRALAKAHVADLDSRIERLMEMRMTLNRLVSCCDGDNRPHCPIIETLAGG
ncbi:MAG: Cu(I)-responsive transcriptional regulator [Alphaproteobacteria bacterium]|nr:Cu(I)-responsive transcriptional regulator [Alphaproteobacteria bacterium]